MATENGTNFHEDIASYIKGKLNNIFLHILINISVYNHCFIHHFRKKTAMKFNVVRFLLSSCTVDLNLNHHQLLNLTLFQTSKRPFI